MQERCKKYYGRESEVLYPPFDAAYWQRIKNYELGIKNELKNIKNKKYYLVVSRLEPYKRVDIAIEAFNKIKENLVVVGTGTQETKLKRSAGNNITFIKNATDADLARLYTEAQAFIMPQEEDFGLVALEAQFFGTPVIAYKKGGAVETVQDGKTGIFFDAQTSGSLTKAIARFETIAYNLQVSTKVAGLKHTKLFDKELFVKNFINALHY